MGGWHEAGCKGREAACAKAQASFIRADLPELGPSGGKGHDGIGAEGVAGEERKGEGSGGGWWSASEEEGVVEGEYEAYGGARERQACRDELEGQIRVLRGQLDEGKRELQRVSEEMKRERGARVRAEHRERVREPQGWQHAGWLKRREWLEQQGREREARAQQAWGQVVEQQRVALRVLGDEVRGMEEVGGRVKYVVVEVCGSGAHTQPNRKKQVRYKNIK